MYLRNYPAICSLMGITRNSDGFLYLDAHANNTSGGKSVHNFLKLECIGSEFFIVVNETTAQVENDELFPYLSKWLKSTQFSYYSVWIKWRCRHSVNTTALQFDLNNREGEGIFSCAYFLYPDSLDTFQITKHIDLLESYGGEDLGPNAPWLDVRRAAADKALDNLDLKYILTLSEVKSIFELAFLLGDRRELK